MKYCIIVPDGLADRPLQRLDGKTCVEVARTPNLDALSQEGLLGMVCTIPHGFHPGSDVANLSIVGYDPARYYSGRAPLEAMNMGVELSETDWALRCNLTTVSDGKMSDFTAGHISNSEGELLIKAIQEKLGADDITFYPGVSYRNLMVYRGSLPMELETTPPHDIVGQVIDGHLPRGKGAELLLDLMNRSIPILAEHEVNRVRLDLEQNPANMIWLWGQGRRPYMESFQERYGVTGAAISAVDLVRGIAKSIGWDVINVPGATGYIDTDYAAKGRYALGALKSHDLVFVHIEATDEAGHESNMTHKIRAMENIDKLIIGPIKQHAAETGNLRIMVLPDHATPISVGTHVDDPVPFVIWDPLSAPRSGKDFSEVNAAMSGIMLKEGHRLMEHFLKGVWEF
ncbi:MAG TPA: cofactor-independent phosphoglycerate mutase [Candidatus Brocadiia bacterium]|nr:cofactor-independent phosphoglycerate mutase [Candidatus Brocadiia bacterium]